MHQVAYYAQTAHNEAPRTQAEWDAYRYAIAVKSGDFGNGYCTVFRQRIDKRNPAMARTIFGKFVSDTLIKKNATEAFLVPVPSKDSFDQAEFRSLAMLRAAVPTRVRQFLPIVRFTSAQERASQGGARGYNAVYPHLTVRRGLPSRRVVIIDDILTSGGSILATRKRLMEAGHDVIGAIVCGRTTHAHLDVFAGGSSVVSDGATEVPFLE